MLFFAAGVRSLDGNRVGGSIAGEDYIRGRAAVAGCQQRQLISLAFVAPFLFQRMCGGRSRRWLEAPARDPVIFQRLRPLRGAFARDHACFQGMQMVMLRMRCGVLGGGMCGVLWILNGSLGLESDSAVSRLPFTYGSVSASRGCIWVSWPLYYGHCPKRRPKNYASRLWGVFSRSVYCGDVM